MSRMQFASTDPHKRLIAGVVGVAGLMASLLVGAAATMTAADYLGAPFIAFVLGIWVAASAYVRAWNRWSPWAPKTNEGGSS